jgi:hypothetical protein
MQEDKASAMEAAKLLCHLHEHIPVPHKERREAIAVRFPDFALIGDVADADKHHTLRDQKRAVANFNQIEERIAITLYQDAEGQYKHVEKRVFLKLTAGGERDVFDLLTSVMNFWIAELTRWGYIGELTPYSGAPRPQPIPRAEADGRMHVQHMQGVPMTQTFMIQRYNEATGQIEPEDISGSEFKWETRKLDLAFDIIRSNPATGETLTHTVQIPDDVAMQLQMMPEQLRGPFLSNHPLFRDAVRATDEEIKRRMQATAED